MLDQEKIFENLISRAESLKIIIKKRNWRLQQDLIVGPGASLREVLEIQGDAGINLPLEYIQLFVIARRVEFRYQFKEYPPAEFKGIFSGEIYWNLDTLKSKVQDLKQWIEASTDPRYNDESAIAITKEVAGDVAPLMRVPNGDMIVVGRHPAAVIYLSHEGDKMHGKKLADNIWDFLEFQTKVGFIGPEDWQFEPFYDFDRNELIKYGDKVERFLSWFNG
jgi:hypothetical protein